MGARLPILIALVALGGCIPREPRAAPETPDMPPPERPRDVGPPRLELDLSHLSDRPQWEMRPVVANAVAEGDARYHVVAQGETGIAIARAYGVPWREIVAANGLTEPFVLRAGQRLALPEAKRDVSVSRHAPLQLDIDDILTGGEPAGARPVAPSPTLSASAGRFLWPTGGSIVGRFGPAGTGRFNPGIDIAAKPGGDVRAAAAGTVAYVGTGVPGYGGLILVRHDGGWISAYGRVASAAVGKNTAVKAGQIIGRAGNDAPLHFELRKARAPVDPVKYLARR